MSIWLVTALVLVVGCERGDRHSKVVAAVAVTAEPQITLQKRIAFAAGADVRGLSGLASGDGGVIWAVPERDRFVVSLRAVGERIEIEEMLRLDGVPPGWDTESIAYLGDGKFVFGTETQTARSQDELLLAERAASTVTVTDRIVLNYDLWGIEGSVNHGIEGLCVDGDSLFVGVETAIRIEGHRLAPVARYQRTTSEWTAFRVRLHTETGLVSALLCRSVQGQDEIELFAIERHYGVAVLLRFLLPRVGGGGDVGSEVIANLGDLVVGIPNMEGLVELSEREIGIVVDNDTGGVSGPNEMIILRLGASRGARNPPASVDSSR